MASDLFFTLAQACRQGERLRMAYTDREGNETERRIDPYRLVRSGPRWYLVARDVERDAWRTLRLDRIDAVEVTRQPVQIDEPPDAVDMVAQAMSQAPYAVQARLRMAIPLAAAQRLVPQRVASLVADGPEATIATIGAPDVDGMARWVAGFPVPVEILDPPELRQALLAHLSAMVERNR